VTTTLGKQTVEGGRLRVLGIAGSLRSGSYNRALLRAAQELAPDGIEVGSFDLRGLPLYDGDLESVGDPAPVVALKRAISDADALLLVSPEYNHGTSGVLKNALDWASRPALASPLAGKPVALAGASTGMGATARAQEQLRQALAFPRAVVVPEPQLRVAQAYAKFDGDGRLIDAGTRAQLVALLEALRQAAPSSAELRRAA
jgi:chromate reductase